jgi:hypothetical protein
MLVISGSERSARSRSVTAVPSKGASNGQILAAVTCSSAIVILILAVWGAYVGA